METFELVVASFVSCITAEKLISVGFSIGILVAAWLIRKLLQKHLLKFESTTKYNQRFVSFAARLIKIIFISVVTLSVLNVLGINIEGVIRTVMLIGFAVSYLLKETVSNVVSGFFILGYRPFQIGQELSVTTDNHETYQGKVTTIDLRYTTLENEKSTILMPNSFLFTLPLVIIKK